jgi:Protein of unknown function (DUF3592)
MPILLKPSVSGKLPSATSNAWGALVAALLLCGAGLYFFLPGMSQLHDWQKLERDGQTTAGIVVDHEKISSKSARTSLTCAYMVEGRRFLEMEYVRSGYYDTIRVGDGIAITYAPNNPALFRTEGSLKYSMALWGVGGGIGCFVVTLVLLILAIVYFASASSQSRR